MNDNIPQDSILRRHYEQLQQAGSAASNAAPQSAPQAATTQQPPSASPTTNPPRQAAAHNPPQAQPAERKGFLSRLLGKFFGG